MSKPIQKLMSDSVKRRCEGVSSACVVDLSGLDAISTNIMRGELKKKNIQMHVVKNSSARRALAGGPLEPLINTLAGPSALVHGDPAITDIAKELAKWAKEHKTIQLKNAIMDGDPDLFSVAELSKMKGRLELVADIAAAISSPARLIASQLGSSVARIAGCMKELSEKNEAA